MFLEFLKWLAVVITFDAFVLFVFGAFRHRWLPFRVFCALAASACIAGLIAFAVS